MMKDSESGKKQTHRNSKGNGKKRMGRPKGSRVEPKYVNITMHDGAIRKLEEHEQPNEHLNRLLHRACDWLLTRIQARGHALLRMLSMTAAGCSAVIALLYMASRV